MPEAFLQKCVLETVDFCRSDVSREKRTKISNRQTLKINPDVNRKSKDRVSKTFFLHKLSFRFRLQIKKL